MKFEIQDCIFEERQGLNVKSSDSRSKMKITEQDLTDHMKIVIRENRMFRDVVSTLMNNDVNENQLLKIFMIICNENKKLTDLCEKLTKESKRIY